MIENASDAHRDEAARLVVEAKFLTDEGKYDEAQWRLERARQLDPESPEVHYRLGLLFADTRRLPSALDSYDAAVALTPSDPRFHNNRGSVLQQLGRIEDAASAFQQAIDLAPDLQPPYVNLGNLLFQSGRGALAIEVYERAIARGLDAGVFRQFIAAARGEATPRSPDAWVRATFDNFAPVFDAHLQSLGYAVPGQLANLLKRHLSASVDILDLGCGTGLCGVSLAASRKSLVGIDLSEQMLSFAKQRGVYDELRKSEIHEWLCRAGAETFDVVIAADVFIYIGALENVFSEIARVTRRGGWLAFSIEENDGTDYVLRSSGRYAQSTGYIERLAKPSFRIVDNVAEAIRTEKGVPLWGRLLLMQRT